MKDERRQTVWRDASRAASFVTLGERTVSKVTVLLAIMLLSSVLALARGLHSPILWRRSLSHPQCQRAAAHQSRKVPLQGRGEQDNHSAGRKSKTMSLSVLTWNVEWATLGSPRTAEILRRIEHHSPEVVCLTETNDELLSQTGHCIVSRPDYGYPIKAGRRKVMLWSREPWEQVDDLGVDSMPPGRFVSGVTRTSLGEIRVVGVCIPWFGSRIEPQARAGTQDVVGRPRTVPDRPC